MHWNEHTSLHSISSRSGRIVVVNKTNIIVCLFIQRKRASVQHICVCKQCTKFSNAARGWLVFICFLSTVVALRLMDRFWRFFWTLHAGTFLFSGAFDVTLACLYNVHEVNCVCKYHFHESLHGSLSSF